MSLHLRGQGLVFGRRARSASLPPVNDTKEQCQDGNTGHERVAPLGRGPAVIANVRRRLVRHGINSRTGPWTSIKEADNHQDSRENRKVASAVDAVPLYVEDKTDKENKELTHEGNHNVGGKVVEALKGADVKESAGPEDSKDTEEKHEIKPDVKECNRRLGRDGRAVRPRLLDVVNRVEMVQHGERDF